MNPCLSNRRNAGMTLFEVGVVVAVVMILALVLLPRFPRSRSGSVRISCISHLKQVGLAYRIWEGDNGDILPMGISITNGGSMESAAMGEVLRSFLVMSNELSTPKILFCPADTTRTPAFDFATLSKSNISYFVGVDVTNEMNPQMILSGDSHLEIVGVPLKSGLQEIPTNALITWTAARHMSAGNIGLADGSVQQTTSPRLRELWQQTGVATNRLALP